MEPAETLNADTSDEDDSPVLLLQDAEGLAAECVVADRRWLGVFDGPFRERAGAAIRSCLETAGRGPAEIALLLTDDRGMAALNGAHRGSHAPTNVLSFPGDASGGGHLGDIAMAWETVRKEAGELGVDAGDHALHLMVHGVLHLLGHDHGTDEEAASMERAETAILARFGVADPHAGDRPAGGGAG